VQLHAPYAQQALTARAHVVPSAKASLYNGGALSARVASSSSAQQSNGASPAFPAPNGSFVAPRPGVGVAAVAKMSVSHPTRAGFAEHAFQHQQQQLQQQRQQQHSTVLPADEAAQSLVHSLPTSYAAHALSKFNHRPSFGSRGSFRAVPETRDAYDRGLHASQRLW
jgi:hypothetical protein